MSINILAGSIMIEQFGKIRITDDGLISIFDLIKVVAGQKDPYNVWIRVSSNYPDVLTSCQNFKFPGRGQKLTPVCDQKTGLKIIGLMQGEVGDKYRDAAAELVTAYLQNPKRLAQLGIARAEQIAPEDLEDIAASLEEAQNRVKGIEKRLSFTDVCKMQGIEGFGYAQATNQVYMASLGMEAKDIKKLATGSEKAKGSARSYLKNHAICMLEWVEGLAAEIATEQQVDVVNLATEFAEQATRNLNPLANSKLREVRNKPLTPNKARKIAKVI